VNESTSELFSLFTVKENNLSLTDSRISCRPSQRFSAWYYMHSPGDATRSWCANKSLPVIEVWRWLFAYLYATALY